LPLHDASLRGAANHGLSPAEALEKHKQEFARQLARQRFALLLVGIFLAIFSALLIVVPLLCAGIVFK